MRDIAEAFTAACLAGSTYCAWRAWLAWRDDRTTRGHFWLWEVEQYEWRRDIRRQQLLAAFDIDEDDE